jgi:hypothetical protein
MCSEVERREEKVWLTRQNVGESIFRFIFLQIRAVLRKHLGKFFQILHTTSQHAPVIIKTENKF